MYERFTDRARKILQLANQEALRLNHEYVGSEHLLIGLVKEGSGVAANVLKNLDIDLRKIRLEVEKIVQPGPDRVSMGKLPQTPRCKKVVEYAIESARELNHNYVGSEHLLMGLIRETEGVASQVLDTLGATAEKVKQGVMELLGHNRPKAEKPSSFATLDVVLIEKTSDLLASVKSKFTAGAHLVIVKKNGVDQFLAASPRLIQIIEQLSHYAKEPSPDAGAGPAGPVGPEGEGKAS